MICWLDPRVPRTFSCGYHRGQTAKGNNFVICFKTKYFTVYLSHVTQSDGSFAGAVDEEIALLGVELGGGDDLRELLHVGGLDVHDVEGLVRDLHVPQIDPQVVRRQIRLLHNTLFT